MKKLLSLFTSLVFLLSLSSCATKVKDGNAENVKITKVDSEIYTDEEIEAAIDVIKEYFEKHFSDCTLTQMEYVGDEELDDYQGFKERSDADEVIVFVSSFDVGDDADESLGPDSCENWLWILVRNSGGEWKHEDHGY